VTDRQLKDWWPSIYAAPKARPYIVDDGDTKFLQFDDRCVQSSMRTGDPNALVFSYCRAMMGFLLFKPAPLHILAVGLGGGSLSKYCYHHLPGCTVTTVEISAAVIALRDEFAIPADSERFRVVHADAALYMRDQRATFDVILLDGFAADGLPDSLSSQAFYDQCITALRPGGVLTANLWGDDVDACLSRLRLSFDQRVLLTGSTTDDNRIAIGLKQVALPAWPELQARARHWQRQTAINFTGLLDQLRLNACQSGDSWFNERR
jgi:spermidine synthase